MLSLADQVCRNECSLGRVVGEHRDLGGSCLGVDADQALEETLGGDGVDVARAGDEIDLLAAGNAVGEHRDGLGAPDGVDLVDAEQSAGSEDGRVWQAAELLLGRGGEGDRSDAGNLRRDHVHDHGGDEGCQAPGHVEADSPYGHHPLLDDGTGCEFRALVGLELLGTRGAEATDRLLETGADRGVEDFECVGDGFRWDAYVGLLDAVELRGVLPNRLDATVTHVVTDGPHHMNRRFDVEVRARHGAAVVGAGGASPKVDTADHGSESSRQRAVSFPASPMVEPVPDGRPCISLVELVETPAAAPLVEPVRRWSSLS